MNALLRGFLAATSPGEAERALVPLMDAATALMERALIRRGSALNQDELEEAVSEARTRLLRHLGSAGTSATGGRQPARPEIEDFAGYVITTTYSAWAQNVRRRSPARAMLLNRLRYLLEDRTNQRGFALWTGGDGKTWAGFDAWRGQGPSGEAAERGGRLSADPRSVGVEIHGVDGGRSLTLAQEVAALLRWLGGPLRLSELTDYLAACRDLPAGRSDALLPPAGDDEAHPAESVDGGPTPHDDLRWKDGLTWLLRRAADLSLPQRRAFLLHSSCLREMELLGLVGIRRAAALVELPPERMAEHWPSIPLEDRVIAAILGLGTQQVVNLRKAARMILGRAWRHYLRES